MQNLNTLLNRLLEFDIDFVLIGGYAAVVHGSSQVTQDLDICAVLTETELTKLKAALVDLDPKHRMNPTFQPSLFDHPVKVGEIDNYYLKTKIGVLDILKEAQPAGNFDQIKQRSVRVNIYGKPCQVVSLDDLIKIKESMKRPKDLAVLEELLAIKKTLQKP